MSKPCPQCENRTGLRPVTLGYTSGWRCHVCSFEATWLGLDAARQKHKRELPERAAKMEALLTGPEVDQPTPKTSEDT